MSEEQKRSRDKVPNFEEIKRALGEFKSISDISGPPTRKLKSPPVLGPALINEDILQAEIQLAYIKAAMAICESSNALAVEVHVAGLPPIGISVNVRMLNVLALEAREIEKFLKGEPNEYE